MRWLLKIPLLIFWGVLWVVGWIFEHLLKVKLKSEDYGTFALMAMITVILLAILVVGLVVFVAWWLI